MKWEACILAAVLLGALLLVSAGCDEGGGKDIDDMDLPSKKIVDYRPDIPRPTSTKDTSLHEPKQSKDGSQNIDDILFSDIYPGLGSTEDFGEGPWNNRILSATSTTVLGWMRKKEILSEQASSPDAIVDGEGRLRVYYIDSKNGGVSVAIKSGEKWIYKKAGVEDGVERVSVVTDGAKYRMYYQLGKQILSATSQNGVYFDRETGIRYEGTDISGFDVFKSPAGWSLIVSESGKFYLAQSLDGLVFGATRDTGVPGYEGDVVMTDDKYMLFFHDIFGRKNSALSASSPDALNWTKTSGVRLFASTKLDFYGIMGPTVVKTGDKEYTMFYYASMG